MHNLYLSAQFVRAEINRLLEECPELEWDELLRADMIEGETDAIELITLALTERQEALAMQEAIKLRIADLSERAARFGRKADSRKALIQRIMQHADLPKLELTEATLSVTKPRTSVEVLNVGDLPQGYFKLERKADKTAIKKSLEAGEAIPGATLVRGDPGLMVRTK